MKKQANKTADKIIEEQSIYVKMNLDLPKKSSMTRCVAIGIEDGKQIAYLFPDHDALKQFPALVIETTYANAEEFSKAGKNVILAWHEQIFKCEPPKKQDIEITALWVWSYWLKNGKPLLPQTNATVDPVSGKVARKSTLGSRVYTVIANGTVPKTPQAVACHQILADACKETGSVTEEVLKKMVIARALELKTRQDPWRIFQYYRPQLIAGKCLRCS